MCALRTLCTFNRRRWMFYRFVYMFCAVRLWSHVMPFGFRFVASIKCQQLIHVRFCDRKNWWTKQLGFLLVSLVIVTLYTRVAHHRTLHGSHRSSYVQCQTHVILFALDFNRSILTNRNQATAIGVRVCVCAMCVCGICGPLCPLYHRFTIHAFGCCHWH